MYVVITIFFFPLPFYEYTQLYTCISKELIPKARPDVDLTSFI